jgi:hypothetical protein
MAVNSELDELLSDAPLETPAPDAQQQAPVDASQTRDEHGRFAPKQQEQPTATQPTETTAQPDPQGQNGGVPVKAVQDEREKRQEAQQRASDLERQLAVLQGQVTLLSQQRQPPQQQQQEKQPVALWDDPDAFLNEQLSPFKSEIQQMREELWESRASTVHGAEKVEAAKKAAESIFGTPAGRMLHQQITASGNPFDNLVKWHQQQQAMTTVGDDPEKWFQTKFEEMLADPAKQAEILERIRSGAPSVQNNGKPITNFAPSLSRMPSGGNQAPDNDMSDGALFSFATQR